MPISKTISKARPDHPSLDFEGLRTEGIRHLEHLATEVWTDYNAHDPGITLLELLCYAITDLGYRTRMLPVADLMADPQRDYKPWFTAAEVLPNAPVTGLDYRKLLIDVKGVKNAWVMGGDAEVGLNSKGVVFPALSDGNYILSPEKITQFLSAHWKEIFPGQAAMPDIHISGLIDQITAEQNKVSSLSDIQSYLQALGDPTNYWELEIQKQLDSEAVAADSNQIKEILGFISTYPSNPDLPWPLPELDPEKDITAEMRALFDAGYTELELLQKGAIRNFPYRDLSPNITDQIIIDSVIDYLIQNNETATLQGSAKDLYDQITESGPVNQPKLARKRLHVLQEEYKRVTDQPNKLPMVIAFYEKRERYREDGFFSDGFKAAFFTAGSWQVKSKGIANFLVNAFNFSDATELANTILAYYEETNSIVSAEFKKIISYLYDEKFCEYGVLGVSTTGLDSSDPLPLSGLYTILIDLDEDIDTGIPNCVNEVIDRVRDLLQAHRALCEDYVSIQVVEQRPIAVCVSLDLAPDTDELEIVAEAVRLMQAYLSPVPRFRTFAQRVAELKEGGKNYSAEEIYNGPLLLNGFLVDEELGGSMPRNQYWHSDLLREIMSVQGILGAPNLKVNPTPEQASSSFDEITEYKVRGGDYDTPGEHYKPVIDLKRSYFQITKGARTFQLDVDQIAERLELLRLINSPDPMEPVGGPVWEEGRYRPDLSSYRSLQYDLPVTYLVGDNRPPLDAKLQRKAQAKQLQAYLAFYDQIFASYLAQLGRVRQLLSIDQSADEPTRVLPLLYDMPGIRDLIGYDAPITAEAADWTSILLGIRDDLHSVVVLEGKNRKNDRQLVGQLLTELRSRTRFRGLFDLRDGLKKAFAAHPKLYELYGGPIEDYFWAKYTADDKNRYASLVKEMAESPADQRRRKNQLLDHLIARFGEAFGSYAATLLRPQSEPEDNPLQQTFEEYLEAKATFLRDIASLAAERNQAYNYKLFNNLENVADVWNTLNVSGLQKRISRKLGIKGWQTRSLIAEPPYRIDMQRGANNRGVANFKAVLRRRLEVHSSELNPLEAVPLLSSPPYASQRAAQNKINELYKSVWQAAYYPPSSAVPDAVDYWFTLLDETEGRKSAVMVKRYDPAAPKDSKTKTKTHLVKQAGVDVQVEIMLQSDPLSADEASNLIRDKVLPLVKPVANTREQEGFHIVEHILLRPMQADDNLLQLHLGCVPEEIPRDPYSFWITVVAPAETARFADADFRAYFEHEFRTETPAHIAVRFCYLGLEDMYKFEEVFAVWMFEKAKCSPNYCRAEEATNRLVQLLNDLHCSCGCPKAPELDPCQKQTS